MGTSDGKSRDRAALEALDAGWEEEKEPHPDDLDGGWGDADEPDDATPPEEPEEPEPPGLTPAERAARTADLAARAAARKERIRAAAAEKKERRRARSQATAEKQKAKRKKGGRRDSRVAKPERSTTEDAPLATVREARGEATPQRVVRSQSTTIVVMILVAVVVTVAVVMYLRR